jgi:ammonium transporter, Amt family
MRASQVSSLCVLVAACVAVAARASAQETAARSAPSYSAIDTLWVLIAAFLVFFMQAGFAFAEAGMIRAKNAANVLMKNLMDFCVGSLGYYAIGYALMWGGTGLFIGTAGFFLIGAESPVAPLPFAAFWFFQVTFAATATTIVSGAVAERMRFVTYLVYSLIMTAFVYPVVGHWIWGGGWLSRLGFHDFAGSTVVHAIGGVTALVAVLVLGPRLGRFQPDGTPAYIGGHSIPLSTLGVLILWIGWYGFNPGSTLSMSNPELVARIAVTTTLGGSAAAVTAMIAAWVKFGKPDAGLILNGVLAGLVGVTAGCAVIGYGSAIVIGVVSGILVVQATHLLNRLGIDDAVGAFPVHGVNGIWGTVAVGLFGQKALGGPADGLFFGGGFGQLGIQCLGVFSATIFVAVVMLVVFKGLDALLGMRVSEETELRGLDVDEHGLDAYGGFQIFVTD